MFVQSKIFNAVASRAKLCSLLPSPVHSASCSTKPDLSKYDPRTEEVKKILTPWKYTKDYQTGSFMKALLAHKSMTGMLKFLQTPIDMRGSKISSWIAKRKYLYELRHQEFSERRFDDLGSDISAGHAFLPLGAKLLYKGKPWINGFEGKTRVDEVPDEYQVGWSLEAIDLSECPVRYEGFINLRNLNYVHTLTAQKCSYLDDWCLDIITSELLSLENIDLSGCRSISPRGLITFTRLPNLRSLDLSDCPVSKTIDGKLVCLLLEDYNSNLSVKGVVFDDLHRNEVPGDLKDKQ